jgi:phosphoglycerate kinase
MDKKTVRDIELAGKRVFLRTDFNVPLDDKTGKILDDSRIQAGVPTIQYLINHQAKVILSLSPGIVWDARLKPPSA